MIDYLYYLFISIKCPCDQPSPVFIGIIEWYLSEPNFDFKKKQLNWGVKACFNRYKMDSAQDLRIKHGIISVRKTLDMNAIKFFRKWKHNLPAFSQLNLETARITSHDRTKKLYYRAHTRSEQMRNSSTSVERFT